ncbi:hypothetical protein ACTMTJ_14100 [Phytohabitans sp. LJ34]
MAAAPGLTPSAAGPAAVGAASSAVLALATVVFVVRRSRPS